MRRRIWFFIKRAAGQPEGSILPVWLLVVRAILFPLEFLFWRMSGSRGYQLESDTWLIEGVQYSAEALRATTARDGQLLRVWRRDGVVMISLVYEETVDS